MNISKWIILFSLCIILFHYLEARVVSSCNSGQFPCSDGIKCIPKNFHCDKETDCQDGSDEVGCSRFFIYQLYFSNLFSFFFLFFKSFFLIEMKKGFFFFLSCLDFAIQTIPLCSLFTKLHLPLLYHPKIWMRTRVLM